MNLGLKSSVAFYSGTAHLAAHTEKTGSVVTIFIWMLERIEGGEVVLPVIARAISRCSHMANADTLASKQVKHSSVVLNEAHSKSGTELCLTTESIIQIPSPSLQRRELKSTSILCSH